MAVCEQRDSGIPWIGEMPGHWLLRRYKHIFKERDERSKYGSETLLSVSAYTGVSPRSDLIGDGELEHRAASLEGYKKCQAGDLVMNIMLAWNRAQGITRFDGIVSPAYSVFEMVDDADDRFLDYLVRCDTTISYFKAWSYGIIESRLRLYPETFGSLFCALPPSEEQSLIADHLDRATTRIDALIAKKTRFIELLREKRQALITHAVTKGLDAGVPMKDSGVEWLGEVPAHWRIGRFKHAGQFQTGSDHKHLPDGDVPVFGSSEIPFDFVASVMATGPAIAIGRKGTIDKPFILEGDFWAVDTCMFNHVSNPAFCIRYCYYFATIVPWLDYSTKTALPSLTQSQVNNAPLLIADVNEQQAIAAFLDRATFRIDTLLNKTERSIELLREHRTALITAAVTGKIDLRNAV